MIEQRKGIQGFMRLSEVLKIFPVSRTHFLDGVKSGKYPKPVHLSERIVAYKTQDIENLIERMGKG
jgi:predicted DNA-binding transcriptional regulator AlpA